MRKLFRKVKNRSSSYDASLTQIRQDGDYVYERFYEPEERADVKVYAVGGDYFHAEARKAPHVDGVVERDAVGKEHRAKVALSREEVNICRRVVDVFDQFFLGFDLLRCADGGRFIIDVNGWSLVKHFESDYVPKCARAFVDHVLFRLREATSRRVGSLHLTRTLTVGSGAIVGESDSVDDSCNGNGVVNGNVGGAGGTSSTASASSPPSLVVATASRMGNDLFDNRDSPSSSSFPCAV